MRVTALTRLLFAVGTLWPKRSLMLPLAIPLPTLYFIVYHVLQFCDLIVTNEDGTEHVWHTYYPALEYPYFMIDMTFYLYLSFSSRITRARVSDQILLSMLSLQSLIPSNLNLFMELAECKKISPFSGKTKLNASIPISRL